MTAIDSPSKEKKDYIIAVKVNRNGSTKFHFFSPGEQIGDVVTDDIVSIALLYEAFDYVMNNIDNIPKPRVKTRKLFTWHGSLAKTIYDYLSSTQMK